MIDRVVHKYMKSFMNYDKFKVGKNPIDKLLELGMYQSLRKYGCLTPKELEIVNSRIKTLDNENC